MDMDFAVSENILAGNVMTRRASYKFASLLPKDASGLVDSILKSEEEHVDWLETQLELVEKLGEQNDLCSAR